MNEDLKTWLTVTSSSSEWILVEWIADQYSFSSKLSSCYTIFQRLTTSVCNCTKLWKPSKLVLHNGYLICFMSNSAYTTQLFKPILESYCANSSSAHAYMTLWTTSAREGPHNLSVQFKLDSYYTILQGTSQYHCAYSSTAYYTALQKTLQYPVCNPSSAHAIRPFPRPQNLSAFSFSKPAQSSH